MCYYANILFLLFIRYLQLSSQSYFDDLCPISSRTLRNLCVVLIVTDSSSDLSQIESLRNFVRSRGDDFKNERLQFSYIYVNKQKEFVMNFFDGLSPNERSSLQVSCFIVVLNVRKYANLLSDV